MPEPTADLPSAVRSHLPSMSTPPPAPTQADISDLLDGLDADDFDFDFDDDLSDAGVGVGVRNSVGPPPRVEKVTPPPPPSHNTRTRSRSPSVSPEPHPDALAPDPIPEHIPATVSFTTASKRALPKPSAAAMKRALKIMRDAEKDVEIDERIKRPRMSTPESEERSLSQSALPPPSFRPPSQSLSQPAAQATPPPAMARLPSDSYVTPAPVPASARARVLALFGEEAEPASPSAPSPSVFRMASGAAAPTVNADARARVAALFSASQPPSQPEPSSQDAPPRVSSLFASASPKEPGSGFQTASGAPAPAISASARAQALALFGEDPPASTSTAGLGLLAPASQVGRARTLLDEEPRPSTPAPFRPPLPSSTARPASSQFSAPRRTMSAGRPTAPPSTPSRMPLHPMAENAAGPSTPAPIKLPRRIDIRTPAAATPRRIGLGLGSTPSGKRPRKGFTTPFKTPGAAGSASAPARVTTPLGLRASVAPPAQPAKPGRIWEPVFDLKPRSHRVSMRAAHLLPGFYSPGDLDAMGLPDEICEINLENAIYYQFIAEDASVLGNAQALRRLKFEGCELATAKWVDNHWRLILWKLAGQVRAKPDLFDHKWNWYEVLCQLKYRYEREYGAAQRPLVRRIQEHDSSPSLPMVLCVSGIHRPAPVPNDKGESISQRPYLDLTDGWYHIRALTDDCLARAIQKGKIKVGCKLGISGAKLESGADGSDVLEAYDKSHLVLSGNSTHLARWDARLGAVAQPFVAGLTSLSVDGGIIALMDVVIDKVFPLAYINSDKSIHEPPWNEEEERARVDAWKDKYEAETTRLQEEMKKNLEKITDLASTLASYAEDTNGPVAAEPPDSIDSDFDDLLEADARTMMARLRSLSSSQIVHLARYASRRVEAAVMEERSELEAKLSETCPPRDVRNFRVVRISDARPTRKEAKRSGMLNVWEASGLGDGLVEGRRYLISNLVPGRNGDWSPPNTSTTKEIYLHTRRDTRWQPVGARALGMERDDEELC